MKKLGFLVILALWGPCLFAGFEPKRKLAPIVEPECGELLDPEEAPEAEAEVELRLAPQKELAPLSRHLPENDYFHGPVFAVALRRVFAARYVNGRKAWAEFKTWPDEQKQILRDEVLAQLTLMMNPNFEGAETRFSKGANTHIRFIYGPRAYNDFYTAWESLAALDLEAARARLMNVLDELPADFLADPPKAMSITARLWWFWPWFARESSLGSPLTFAQQVFKQKRTFSYPAFGPSKWANIGPLHLQKMLYGENPPLGIPMHPTEVAFIKKRARAFLQLALEEVWPRQSTARVRNSLYFEKRIEQRVQQESQKIAPAETFFESWSNWIQTARPITFSEWYDPSLRGFIRGIESFAEQAQDIPLNETQIYALKLAIQLKIQEAAENETNSMRILRDRYQHARAEYDSLPVGGTRQAKKMTEMAAIAIEIEARLRHWDAFAGAMDRILSQQDWHYKTIDDLRAMRDRELDKEKVREKERQEHLKTLENDGSETPVLPSGHPYR